ncbi:hypothetical protein OC835_003453 [Tilletia horrida]|nr:hypothetical protein OC835_003453 [Tilletia horrida]
MVQLPTTPTSSSFSPSPSPSPFHSPSPGPASSLPHAEQLEPTTVPLLSVSHDPFESTSPYRTSFLTTSSPRSQRDSFASALSKMAAHRDSFNSMPMSQKNGSSTYLYDPNTMDTPGRHSEAHQSWYSGSPLAEVAAQHSASSPLAGTGAARSAAHHNINEKGRSASGSGGGFWGWCKRKPWIALLLLLVIIAAGVGVGIGVSRGMSSSDSEKESAQGGAGNNNNNSNGNSNTSGANGNGSGSSGTRTSDAAPTPTVAPIVPLAPWDWTDPRQKVMGVSLGNYLAIERWLDEDWFRSVAGENVWDEWGLHQTLGAEKTVEVLAEHHKNYIQESDLDELVEYGLNTIRVPLPFWALIPTTGNEPYVNASQLDRLSDVMQWCHKRGLYVIVDLHSMPGSQSGDQASGHNTSNPLFWTDNNQARSVQTVQNLINWISNHPYKSVVSGVCPVNEPRAQFGFSSNDPEKLGILRTFYARTYSMLSRAQLPMIFHPSFYQGDALAYWADFVTGKDPKMLIYTVHPYPGFFPVKYDTDAMTEAVCKHARDSIGYPVPVMYGEWSAISGVETVSYMKQYYTTQLSAWSWSAGGIFWSYKAPVTQNPVLANTGMQETMFSFVDLMKLGVIPKPNAPLSSNPKDYGVFNFVRGLNGACGSIPISQIGWKSPAAYSSGYSGRRRRAEEREANPSWRRTSRR